MSVRSTFGIDGFDLFVHLVVTICAIIMLGPVMELPPAVALVLVPTASILVLAIRRRLGLRNLPPEALEVDGERVYELEFRVRELEAAQERLLELEERIDFAERLLAREADQARIGKGQNA
jgi:hypothetical protein